MVETRTGYLLNAILKRYRYISQLGDVHYVGTQQFYLLVSCVFLSRLINDKLP
jgi:hypothetical protein